MKNLLFLFLLAPLAFYSNFYEIDVSEKVINFASYCKDDKASVFIISEHACSPCLKTKNFFLSKNYDMKIVDIYYCLITKDNNDLRENKFANRPSNKMWSYIEGCTRPPYIYFYGPTKNRVARQHGYDPEKITKKMSVLLNSLSYYKQELVSYNPSVIKRNKVSNKETCCNKVSKVQNEKEELNLKYETTLEENERLEKIITKKESEITNALTTKNILEDDTALLNLKIRNLETSNNEIIKIKNEISHLHIQIAKNYIIQAEEIFNFLGINNNYKYFLIKEAIKSYEIAETYGKPNCCNDIINEIKKKYKVD